MRPPPWLPHMRLASQVGFGTEVLAGTALEAYHARMSALPVRAPGGTAAA